MCRLQIIKLALETGYSQNDFHPSNLLIDTSYSGYYTGLPGKVIIIDFGYATKIPIPILEMIKYNISNGRYKSALVRLYSLSRSDGVQLRGWPDYYGMIPDEFDYTYNFLSEKDKRNGNRSTQTPRALNEVLDDLSRRIDLQIDRRIEEFNVKHAEQPDKYPLLPVSNAIKNKLFSGIIQGGKRRHYNRPKKIQRSRTYKKRK